jgi:CubicO group peptidase (beta-lactamase class C family)
LLFFERILVLSIAIAIASVQMVLADVPASGREYPGLEPFDQLMISLLNRWRIPGGALAVSRNKHVLLSRGYGYADLERGMPVVPENLFRMASLTKPITSVAIMKLVERGVLRLDQRALPKLGSSAPPQSAIVDPRIASITVGQLLHHTGGFDKDQSGDPMFMGSVTQAARLADAPMPASKYAIIRGVLQQNLDFDPGTKYAYSNFGFNMLGRVIETVSGMPYEDFVRKNVLNPIGVSMWQGHTLETHTNEVRYYDHPDSHLVNPEPGLATGRVPAPYGSFYIEAMDSHGAWISSVPEYLRFWLAVFGQRDRALLDARLLQLMRARPEGLPKHGPVYYGCGIQVRVIGPDRFNYWHTGSLPGTMSIALHSDEGFDWVAAFNSRPKDQNEFEKQLDDGLWKACRAVKRWPQEDLLE